MNLNPFSTPTEIEAAPITEQLSTNLYDRARDDLPILGIRPYRGDDGLERGERLLKSLHEAEWEGRIRTKNVSPSHAFELLYTDSDEILQFRFAPGTEDAKRQMLRQLNTYYPDSDITELSPQFMETPEGKYIAGARLELMEQNYYYPIKHYKIEKEDFTQDPYDSITSEMVGSPELADTDVLVQMILRPAISNHPRDKKNWYSGIPDTLNEMGEQKTSFRKGAIADEMANIFSGAQGGQTREVDFSQTVDLDDDDVYQVVKKQYGEKAYHLNFRIIAVSDDPEVAKSRVMNTAGMYRKFYNTKNRQGFRAVPYTSEELTDFLSAAASREWTDRNIVFPIDTATGACHVPTALNTQQADYSMTTAGKGVPPRTPRFDFESVGLDRATSSPDEKQVALLSDDNPANPVWYGWGTKNGIEAGVDPEILSVHQFVGGSTGMGKTTLLVNYFRQIMQRGHGGLFFDPKGDDAKAVVSLIPEDREDDLIYIDIGADSEYEIGFNFLEVPLRNPEVGTASTEAAVEGLADDLEALLAQSGAGGGWHARMSGITRSVVRGLAQWQIETERDVTMLDMYYALLDEDGRQEYADMMATERIEWVEDYAQRVLADIPQPDVEPLVRRLKEWVESGTTRRIVSHPSSTISIEDVVRDGKIIIVRNRATSDTAKRLIATALIRRLWIAIREQTNSDDEPDPPKFYTVIDEFDKIVSKQSEIHNILREARAFGLSLTLACQNLETGNDDSIGLPEGVQRAIQGNCKTFLTFDPGDPKDAKAIAPQHSPDIDANDLTELSKYHIYMRTHDDHDEKTDSYKAKTLAPALETLPLRGPAETDELVAHAQKTHGQKARTSQQIKEDSLLYPGVPDSDDEADADEPDEIDVTSDPAEQALYEAIYTVQIKLDAIGEFVRNEAVTAEWRRRAGELGFTSVISNVIEQAPDEYIERGRREGDPAMKATPEGLEYAGLAQDTGSSASGGGDEHRWVLTEAYRAFTKLGMYVDLPTQEGDEDPDGLADLPIDPMAGGNVREIREREQQLAEEYPYLAELTEGLNISIEAETSTIKKPMQTLTNLRKAIDAHKLCVFACKDGTANHDEFGYWARRGEQIIYDVSGRGSNRSIDYEALTFASDVDEVGNRTFYNKVKTLAVGPDSYALRPRSDADLLWCEDGEEVVMTDESGTEHARFESHEAVADPSKAAVPAYSEYDPSEGEYTVRSGGEKSVYGSREELEADWMVVRAPFIPENEFERLPTPEDFLFVVFPDGDTEAVDEPMICERGDTRPLLGSGGSWSVQRDGEAVVGGEASQKTDSDEATDGSGDAGTGETNSSHGFLNG